MAIDYQQGFGGDGFRGEVVTRRDPSLGKTLKNEGKTRWFDIKELIELVKKNQARIFRSTDGDYIIRSDTFGEWRTVSLDAVKDIINKGYIKPSNVEGLDMDAPELIERENQALAAKGWELRFVGAKYKNKGCLVFGPDQDAGGWGEVLGVYPNPDEAKKAQELAMSYVTREGFNSAEWNNLSV